MSGSEATQRGKPTAAAGPQHRRRCRRRRLGQPCRPCSPRAAEGASLADTQVWLQLEGGRRLVAFPLPDGSFSFGRVPLGVHTLGVEHPALVYPTAKLDVGATRKGKVTATAVDVPGVSKATLLLRRCTLAWAAGGTHAPRVPACSEWSGEPHSEQNLPPPPSPAATRAAIPAAAAACGADGVLRGAAGAAAGCGRGEVGVAGSQVTVAAPAVVLRWCGLPWGQVCASLSSCHGACLPTCLQKRQGFNVIAFLKTPYVSSFAGPAGSLRRPWPGCGCEWPCPSAASTNISVCAWLQGMMAAFMLFSVFIMPKLKIDPEVRCKGCCAEPAALSPLRRACCAR